MDQTAIHDIFVIGGGINGCGIARDAVGRGYSVFLAEMNDLASGTSSGSTKLIHGGLRYLEYYEFRLVRESLMEREVLWRMAPHIIWPLRFVLPYAEGLRPAWLLRLGLFLYDHIGGRKLLPATQDAGHAQRPGRQAAEAAVHARPSNIPTAGSTMRGWWCSTPATRPIAARRSAPAPRWSARAATAIIWTISVEDTAQRRGRRGEGAAARQRRRPVGRPRAVGRASARTTCTMCGWCRAATSSSRRSSTIRAPISSRTPTAASSSPFPTRTSSR